MSENRIWDPLRKREVMLTPEERVRQWFIGVLREEMGVPAHMMRSEVQLRFGAAAKKKIWRADIVVYDRAGAPLMAVECKRPEMPLGQEAADQTMRYNHVLDVKYIAITNGLRTFIFRREPEGFAALDRLPAWTEMLSDEK